jgi:hypothetical protein
MNKFYFKHRNIGLEPDTNKYYFSTIEELTNQVKVLKDTENRKHHFKWSISKMSNDNQYALMSEFWTTEKRGTDIPLKCKGWGVYGYIYTDETDVDLRQILPKWEADYTNHFIERRYMSSDDFKGLSDLEKEKCTNDGGIILNRKYFNDSCSVCGGQDILHEEKRGRGLPPKGWVRKMGDNRKISWSGTWDVWTCKGCGETWSELRR